MVASEQHGAELFRGISAKTATNELRRRLGVLGVNRPEEHVLHSFRSGHAMDLAENGARLHEILRAGEWKSPAFLLYLDINKIESEAAAEAQRAASSAASRKRKRDSPTVSLAKGLACPDTVELGVRALAQEAAEEKHGRQGGLDEEGSSNGVASRRLRLQLR